MRVARRNWKIEVVAGCGRTTAGSRGVCEWGHNGAGELGRLEERVHHGL